MVEEIDSTGLSAKEKSKRISACLKVLKGMTVYQANKFCFDLMREIGDTSIIT